MRSKMENCMESKDLIKNDTRKLTLVVICMSAIVFVLLGILPLI